ncbi:MAG: GntR family transcriptional regulator [Planctomycetaceae bacterium]
MHLHLDTANGLPIYEQIVRHVKFAVANRLLQIGEHVPSVRDMATRLAVNPNTVARAYRDLQSEGILVPIRGTGLAVTPEAPKRCRAERLDLIRTRLRSVLSEAWRNGIDADELRTLFENELTHLGNTNSLVPGS